MCSYIYVSLQWTECRIYLQIYRCSILVSKADTICTVATWYQHLLVGKHVFKRGYSATHANCVMPSNLVDIFSESCHRKLFRCQAQQAMKLWNIAHSQSFLHSYLINFNVTLKSINSSFQTTEMGPALRWCQWKYEWTKISESAMQILVCSSFLQKYLSVFDRFWCFFCCAYERIVQPRALENNIKCNSRGLWQITEEISIATVNTIQSSRCCYSDMISDAVILDGLKTNSKLL